jgi:6-pyruvoyl-tetrahydropterin synthase
MGDWGGAIGVGAFLCAAHEDTQGRMHGHTYDVVAWFPAGEDALVLQERLKREIEPFDHATLCHELAKGESLAAAIFERLSPDVIRVDISRTAERIYARWPRL